MNWRRVTLFLVTVVVSVAVAYALYEYNRGAESRRVEGLITHALVTAAPHWIVRSVDLDADMKRLYIHAEVRDDEVHTIYAEEVKKALEGSLRKTFDPYIIFLDGTNTGREFEWVSRTGEWRVTNR